MKGRVFGRKGSWTFILIYKNQSPTADNRNAVFLGPCPYAFPDGGIARRHTETYRNETVEAWREYRYAVRLKTHPARLDAHEIQRSNRYVTAALSFTD